LIEYILSFVSLYFLTYLLLTYLEEEWIESYSTETPRVSVLIPAYNESETIEKTVQSVLGLDYPNLEIIVIDDGSIDDTADLAQRLGVLVVRQSNSGKANALNRGIKLAKGELIAILDADSFVEQKALRYMIGFFKNPLVMAVTPTMKVRKGKGVLENMQMAEYMFSNLIAKIFSLLESMVITPGPFSVYKAKLFKELGGFDGSSLTEDNEMALRIQSANYPIKSSKKAFVYTKVPKTLGELFRQRKRWYAGYFENLKKYVRLFNPKYGELGSFVLPVTSLLLILTLSKITIDATQGLSNFLQGNLISDVGHFLQPFELLSIMTFLIGLLLFYFSILESKENASLSMLLHLILLGILSPLMYTYTFFIRGFEIITRRSAKW
jgi:cellulose synthase/poly-beta-1,6-N-acetylglucosamine synthase-like glycosyltransferase